MATSSSLSQTLAPAAAGDTLQRVAPRRTLRGFANLLRNENRAWWGTRKWWVHLLLWGVIINGFTGLIVWAEGSEGAAAIELYAEAVQSFFIIGGIAAAIGVVTTTQGAIVGEKQLGTAAWILSKPASRSAFVLAKLVAHAGAFLVLAIGMPAVLLWVQAMRLGGPLLPLVPFLVGLAVLALHLLFYLALTLMLGTLFSARGPIAGLGVGLVIAGQSVPHLLPQVRPFFPWQLPSAAAGLVLGEPLLGEAFVALGATAVWTALFVAVALWRFAHEEF
jgi:ABC-2 type transport system permease protein